MLKTFLPFIIQLLSLQNFCQQKISGLVIDQTSRAPVPFASVVAGKGNGIVTDSTGRFSFIIRKPSQLNDSILISAIGFIEKKVAVKDLEKNNQVLLAHADKELEQVKVFASLKGDYRRFGYYRSWNEKNTGGEIGYIFDLPSKRFQLGAVQVKINHNYDTCWLKLHLRDVANSGLALPEDEIMNNEIVLPVTEKFGLVEFDMSWRQIRIPTNKIYVGFELLHCGCSTSAAPSFFFMGNEQGQNYFKESEESAWKKGGDYTIYVRMLTK